MLVQSCPRAAHWLLRWLIAHLLLTVILGMLWDAYWHVTQPFDTFWSPPHVFVYSMATFGALLVTMMTVAPRVRAAFGRPWTIVPAPLAVPGGLYVLCGGFCTLGIAGLLLDNLWHTTFGLNETPWTLPHAMIGGSLAALAYGAVMCRFALADDRPIGRFGLLLFGYLLLVVSATPLGPLREWNIIAVVEARLAHPVLSLQPGTRELAALVQGWNLTRSNPALIGLGALWAGYAISLLRGIGLRTREVLFIVAVWSWVALRQDQRALAWWNQYTLISPQPAAWLPLPVLPAALAFALMTYTQWFAALPPLFAVHVQRWAKVWSLLATDTQRCAQARPLLAAGWIFGIGTVSIWQADGAWVLPLLALAGPLAVLGARLGTAVAKTLRAPTALGAQVLLFCVAVGVPLITGTADIIMRRWS